MLMYNGSILIYTKEAAEAQNRYFGWGDDKPRPENLVEQGGWILGFLDTACPHPVRALATRFLPATGCKGSPAYLEWPAEENIRLQREYYRIRDEEVPAEKRGSFKILGWVHSHPGPLGVFISGTDHENILLHFNDPSKFSVVLNPQRKIIRAFLGPEHPEVPLIMELPIRADRMERKAGERAVAALTASERKKNRRQRARRRRKRFERRRRRGRR